MGDIVFVPSPVYSTGEAPYPSSPLIPLGLISLASLLKRAGKDARIADISMLSIHPLESLVTNNIMNSKPKIVGFSTMCNSIIDTIKLARICKLIDQNITVLMGGPHATIVCKELISDYPFIDVIAKGECELIICDIVGTILAHGDLSRCPSLIYRNGIDILETSSDPRIVDVNTIPIPDLSLIQNQNSIRVMPIEAGRGCPYGCTFCSTSIFWRKKYRVIDPSQLVKQLYYIFIKYGISQFSFQHDNLTASRLKTIELCEALKTIRPIIKWRCSARIDSLDKQLLENMAQAGCQSIYLGIETGSTVIQKKIKKCLNLGEAQSTVKEIVKIGIEFTASFIIGFPDETIDDLIQTIQLIFALSLISQSDDSVQVHLLSPQPGTPLFSQNRDTIRYDGVFSDFSMPQLDGVNLNEILNNKIIFASYYYYHNPFIERTLFIQLYNFVTAILSMPASLRILCKDKRLDFPRIFISEISSLDKTNKHIENCNKFDLVELVSRNVYSEHGHGEHYVQDVIRYESIVNKLKRRINDSYCYEVTCFDFDVDSIIEKVLNPEGSDIPLKTIQEEHFTMFIKEGNTVRTIHLVPQLGNFLIPQ